jgi:heme exporter protein D
MSEIQQQTEPSVSEKTSTPIHEPLRPWTLRATHRYPAFAWLIVLLILLQLVLGWIVVVQARHLLDLGERIERLEKMQSSGAE